MAGLLEDSWSDAGCKTMKLTSFTDHSLRVLIWISTVRGKRGGIVLVKPATDIVVGKVVRDTEGAAMPAECFAPDESNYVIARYCRLKNVLAEAVNGFYGVLDQDTLADIRRNKLVLSSVLRFHKPASAAHAR